MVASEGTASLIYIIQFQLASTIDNFSAFILCSFHCDSNGYVAEYDLDNLSPLNYAYKKFPFVIRLSTKSLLDALQVRQHSATVLTISFDTLLTVPALTLELQCTSSLFKRASLFIEDFGITPKHASERRPLCAFPLCLEMEHPSDLNEWLTPLIATSENDCHSIRCSCSSENSTLVLEIPETETRIEVRNLTIISESGDQSIDFLMATQACKFLCLLSRQLSNRLLTLHFGQSLEPMVLISTPSPCSSSASCHVKVVIATYPVEYEALAFKTNVSISSGLLLHTNGDVLTNPTISRSSIDAFNADPTLDLSDISPLSAESTPTNPWDMSQSPLSTACPRAKKQKKSSEFSFTSFSNEDYIPSTPPNLR
ncbi:hypothetical protein MDAP_002486 [Mitosporidium daphniae]